MVIWYYWWCNRDKLMPMDFYCAFSTKERLEGWTEDTQTLSICCTWCCHCMGAHNYGKFSNTIIVSIHTRKYTRTHMHIPFSHGEWFFPFTMGCVYNISIWKMRISTCTSQKHPFKLSIEINGLGFSLFSNISNRISSDRLFFCCCWCKW